jgi:hypothetical protein
MHHELAHIYGLFQVCCISVTVSCFMQQKTGAMVIVKRKMLSICSCAKRMIPVEGAVLWLLGKKMESSAVALKASPFFLLQI